MDFAGKVVIVTGASRGIGKAAAVALGELGGIGGLCCTGY